MGLGSGGRGGGGPSPGMRWDPIAPPGMPVRLFRLPPPPPLRHPPPPFALLFDMCMLFVMVVF